MHNVYQEVNENTLQSSNIINILKAAFHQLY